MSCKNLKFINIGIIVRYLLKQYGMNRVSVLNRKPATIENQY